MGEMWEKWGEMGRRNGRNGEKWEKWVGEMEKWVSLNCALFWNLRPRGEALAACAGMESSEQNSAVRCWLVCQSVWMATGETNTGAGMARRASGPG